MILDNNGQITRFYKWTYGKSEYRLPKNFCNYFWALIFALLILPLTILSLVIQLISFFELEDNTDWTWFGRVSSTIGTVAVLGIGALIVFLFITQPVPAFSFFLGVPLLIFIGWLLFRQNSKVREVTSEAASLIAEKTSSAKDKYCPRIEWLNVPERERGYYDDWD